MGWFSRKKLEPQASHRPSTPPSKKNIETPRSSTSSDRTHPSSKPPSPTERRPYVEKKTHHPSSPITTSSAPHSLKPILGDFLFLGTLADAQHVAQCFPEATDILSVNIAPARPHPPSIIYHPVLRVRVGNTSDLKSAAATLDQAIDRALARMPGAARPPRVLVHGDDASEGAETALVIAHLLAKHRTLFAAFARVVSAAPHAVSPAPPFFAWLQRRERKALGRAEGEPVTVPSLPGSIGARAEMFVTKPKDLYRRELERCRQEVEQRKRQEEARTQRRRQEGVQGAEERQAGARTAQTQHQQYQYPQQQHLQQHQAQQGHLSGTRSSGFERLIPSKTARPKPLIRGYLFLGTDQDVAIWGTRKHFPEGAFAAALGIGWTPEKVDRLRGIEYTRAVPLDVRAHRAPTADLHTAAHAAVAVISELYKKYQGGKLILYDNERGTLAFAVALGWLVLQGSSLHEALEHIVERYGSTPRLSRDWLEQLQCLELATVQRRTRVSYAHPELPADPDLRKAILGEMNSFPGEFR